MTEWEGFVAGIVGLSVAALIASVAVAIASSGVCS